MAGESRRAAWALRILVVGIVLSIIGSVLAGVSSISLLSWSFFAVGAVLVLAGVILITFNGQSNRR